MPALYNKTVVKTKRGGQDLLASLQPTGKATFQISNSLEGRGFSLWEETLSQPM